MLFKDGDKEAICEGILRAVRLKDQLAGLGQAARRMAVERANWQANFKSLIQAYEMALEIGRPKNE